MWTAPKSFEDNNALKDPPALVGPITQLNGSKTVYLSLSRGFSHCPWYWEGTSILLTFWTVVGLIKSKEWYIMNDKYMTLIYWHLHQIPVEGSRGYPIFLWFSSTLRHKTSLNLFCGVGWVRFQGIWATLRRYQHLHLCCLHCLQPLTEWDCQSETHLQGISSKIRTKLGDGAVW